MMILLNKPISYEIYSGIFSGMGVWRGVEFEIEGKDICFKQIVGWEILSRGGENVFGCRFLMSNHHNLLRIIRGRHQNVGHKAT